MSKWIRTGDRVKVIAGNDKGKTGEVIERKQDRILVKNVNIRKKHLKRTERSQGPRIVEMEVSIHVSNVQLCNENGNPFKVKVSQENESGQRKLVYKTGNGNQSAVYRAVKKPA